MKELNYKKPSLFAKVKLTEPLNVSDQEHLVKNYLFDENLNLPFVYESKVKFDAVRRIENNIEEISLKLEKHGAVLLRGFSASVEKFGQIAEKFGKTLPYKERSSPRQAVSGNIYTSTEYPPDQEIFFHNENSYAHKFPSKLFFYCDIEPQNGGATPLADVRLVYKLIPNEIREKFEQKRILYIRNFGHGIGLTWQEVFQTEDRGEAEEICKLSGYQTEWFGKDRLRTKRVGNATFTHPKTNEKVWFNHAAFFHFSTHPEKIRNALISQFAADAMPHNTFYGDGQPIEPETLDVLRDCYRRASVSFAWREGDILLIDNILTAHARAPFSGARKILVAMTE